MAPDSASAVDNHVDVVGRPGKLKLIMKPFFSHTDEATPSVETPVPGSTFAEPRVDRRLAGRVAVYDSPAAAPRIADVFASSASEFIDHLSTTAYESIRALGGSLPFTVIREIVENLIHADFREPVVSVLEGGNTVRFTDQGPGIPDKGKALEPGFTTATLAMKDVIRGVGSGLPIVREFLSRDGGSFSLDDNLGGGCVITLKAESPVQQPDVMELDEAPHAPTVSLHDLPSPKLSTRQKKVLSLVLEFGEVGPTLVSKELSVGLSTAYRDLAYLEQVELIAADESGKRRVTTAGASYFDGLFR